ncbi:MAG: DNA-3-methyladenine glycosylase family protein, partial [Actinomycetota bacterium]
EATLPVGGGRARTVRVSAGKRGHAAVELLGGAAGARDRERLLATVGHMLRLDDDLSPFYAVAAGDEDLAWAAAGAGRMLRSPTVFEDVVKTVCTTNCSWALTTKMTTALVEHLGDPAPDGRRAFPSAEAMAAADESFYREVARSGYRAPYLRALAGSVANGEVDLEALADPELPDDEVAAQLLALPGIGPYGAAHVMLTSLGRYSRLVLDSWTRPTYAKLAGRKAKDSTIERRFRRYREWAGLAFWLYLTRDWVKEET